MKAIGYLVLIFFFVACNPMRNFENVELILFGSGGGFTGEYNINSVDRTGNIRKDGMVIGQADQEQLKKVFSYTQTLKSDTLNNPGNIYNYIEFVENGVKYKYTWNPGKPVNASMSKWYTELNDLIKKESD